MSFRIERSGSPQRKEGQYVVVNGIEFFIESISINNSGKVCLKLRDIFRKTSETHTVCDISHLTQFIAGATENYAE